MNIKKIYANNKGFTTSEIIISIMIIIAFVSIITSGFYNYYISIQEKNRRTIATNAIIDVIENIEMMNYEDITVSLVDNLIQELTNDGTIPEAYTIDVTLQKYNEIPGNENKKDLIKILNVKISYNVSENIEITRLIKNKGDNNEL